MATPETRNSEDSTETQRCEDTQENQKAEETQETQKCEETQETQICAETRETQKCNDTLETRTCENTPETQTCEGASKTHKSKERLSEISSASSHVESVPLKKANTSSLVQDTTEVKRSQSAASQGYDKMDNDLNKTVSADVLPPPDVANDGINDTNKMNNEVLGSFVRAVHRKYSDLGLLENCFMGGLVLPKSSAVKMTESGSILLPNQVSMSGCEISVAGNTDLIQRMCQKVTHLDLMANDIKHWEEVISILECIPTLNFLNLSKNYISSALPDLSGRSLPSVTHLVLNDTAIQWNHLIALLHALPTLEELHLSLNGFTTIDIPDNLSACPSVRKLFFVGNQVTAWSEINKLGKFFPRLESLMLCETEISCLDAEDEIGSSFPELRVLSLNRSCLCSWDEIDKLNNFPCLTDVRLHNIPFFEDFPTKARRHRKVAMLAAITMLNKSPVTDDEREDAERSFIRLFLDKEDKPPRYHQLVAKHGSVAPLVKVDLKPKDTVRVKIYVEEMDESDDSLSWREKPGEMMDIDVHHTPKTLRKLLSNTASHPASKLLLFHYDQYSLAETRMVYPDRKVLAYHIRDGDTIVVVKKP